MKNNLVSEAIVLNELKKALVETLQVDEGVIKSESSFTDDLGAESLDFLDINYRLEQAFGIKMARHFLLEHIEEMFGEGTAIDDEGRLTEKAVTLLNLRYGGNMPEIEAGIDMDEVPAMLTVGPFAKGVMDILNTLPEQCPQCSSSDWKSEDGMKVSCGSCGESAVYTNGDDLIVAWLTDVQQEKNIF